MQQRFYSVFRSPSSISLLFFLSVIGFACMVPFSGTIKVIRVAINFALKLFEEVIKNLNKGKRHILAIVMK